MKTTNQIPKQEFTPFGQHRLVLGEQKTEWAGYRTFTYLNGYVGFTTYYAKTEGVLPADDFCKLIGIT